MQNRHWPNSVRSPNTVLVRQRLSMCKYIYFLDLLVLNQMPCPNFKLSFLVDKGTTTTMKYNKDIRFPICHFKNGPFNCLSNAKCSMLPCCN